MQEINSKPNDLYLTYGGHKMSVYAPDYPTHCAILAQVHSSG